MFVAWLLVLVLSPGDVEYQLGQRVYIKLNAKPTLQGKPVPRSKLPSPAIITAIDQDRLWVERAWVTTSEVMLGDEALIYYTEFLRAAPSPEAYCARASVWVEKGLIDNALRDVNQALKQDARYAPAYLIRGKLHVVNRDSESAISDFTEAIALDPLDARGYISRALVRQSQNDLASALADLSAAISVDPNYPPTYVHRGAVHEASGKLSEAVKDFEKAIELDPNYPTAFIQLGRCEQARQRYAEAAEAFTTAISLQPDDAPGYYYRAIVLEQLADDPQQGSGDDLVASAVADLDRAVKLDDQFADAYLRRAVLKRGQGQDTESVLEDLRLAAKVDPENPEIPFEIGITLANDKATHSDAISHFSKAIELAGNHTEAFYRRGRVWVEMGEYNTALEDFTQAILLDPQHDGAYAYRALSWHQINNRTEALNDATKAIALNPHSGDAYRIRGMVHVSRRNAQAAIDDFTEAIRINPNDWQLFILRAKSYRSANQYQLAVEDLTRVIDHGSDDELRGLAFQERGNCRTGDRILALVDYAKGVAISPDNEEFKDRAERQLRSFLRTINVDAKNTASNRAAASRLKEINQLPADVKQVYQSQIDQWTDEQIKACWRLAKDRNSEFATWLTSVTTTKEHEAAWKSYFARTISPQNWEALCVSAELLATCRTDKYRDGSRAVELASSACELTNWGNSQCLTALAAAYAETGQTAKAVEFQQRAADLADNGLLKKNLEAWIPFFRSGKGRRVAGNLTPADQLRMDAQRRPYNLQDFLKIVKRQWRRGNTLLVINDDGTFKLLAHPEGNTYLLESGRITSIARSTTINEYYLNVRRRNAISNTDSDGFWTWNTKSTELRF